MGASKHRKRPDSYKTKLEDKEDDANDKKKAKEQKEKEPVKVITDDEIKALGLPLEFASSKGKQVQKNPVEAARIGQVRQYQRFGRKKMTAWQIKRVTKRYDKSKMEQ